MATRFLGATQWGAANDTMFRLAAQFIEDTLVTTGGWVVTADTGQTLPSALVAPAAINRRRLSYLQNERCAEGDVPCVHAR